MQSSFVERQDDRNGSVRAVETLGGIFVQLDFSKLGDGFLKYLIVLSVQHKCATQVIQ